MPPITGSLLVTGTSSDVGKSILVAGLCRWLARQGYSVAPFKAQNMSLNSFVTHDGLEIGRAQAAQAVAAGIEPEVAMNPVLLKPGSDTQAQIIVMGRAIGEQRADQYWSKHHSLLPVVTEAFDDLSARFDLVICEGAGSPAEINLRESDIVNLGFARAVNIPSILVGDIDRGGVFASFVGTLAVLSPDDQRSIYGFVVNKFRGDHTLLDPGLRMLEQLTGRPTYGVLPYTHGLALDSEDSLDHTAYRSPTRPLGRHPLRISVVWFPRSSNLTDFDPLIAEPGVVVRFVTHAEELADADLVILPGTRATVEDMAWLRSRGMAKTLVDRAKQHQPILGICGGFQMLGTTIDDSVESSTGRIDGLGLLPVRTEFLPDKHLGRPSHTLPNGTTITGYEIHHGRVEILGGTPFFGDVGVCADATFGTAWHGLFENDVVRRTFLSDIAQLTNRDFRPSATLEFAAQRQARFDTLAELVDQHLDMTSLLQLIDSHRGGNFPPPRVLHLT